MKVLKEDYGFDGYLGYAAGHPALLGMSYRLPVPQPGKEDETRGVEDKGKDDLSLESYLKAQAQSGSTMTIKELLDTWQARKPAKEVIVAAGATSPSTTSTVSTITTDATPANKTQEPSLGHKTPVTTPVPPTPTTVATAPTIVTNVSATQPPVTPAKEALVSPVKKRGRESSTTNKLPPGVKSPNRMLNGNHSWGCDHANLKGFIPCDRRYFTAKECAKPNYPKVCSGCDGLLVRNVDKKREVTIRGILNVMVCKNGFNHRDHECVYALCHACYQEKMDERKSPKKQRKTSNSGANLLPGEVLLANGYIGSSA